MMMKKRIVAAAGILLGAALLFTGARCAMVSASSTKSSTSSSLSTSIKQKQEQIEKAKQEKNDLKKNLSDVQNIKKGLESKKQDLTEYIVELDSQLAQIEERVACLTEDIALKEYEIGETQKQLEDARQRETEQMHSMMVRARLMFEKNEGMALELILESSGLSDLLNRAEYMEKLVTYDKDQWNQLQDMRKYVELCEAQLELEKDILNQTKENVEIEQNTVELFIKQKKQDIEAYKSDIKTQEKAIAEYEALIRQQDEEIRALEKAIEEERKRQQSVKRTYDGGTFTFPIESYTRVSSEFGYRTDPISKVRSFHSGVDLAAAKGTAIYAAYKGVVVAATYSPSMGNYVMIDHGDDLYTIYMHASVLKVSKGDEVKAGQTIALVGTTGRSTGAHLHFTVRKNGTYVSPWEYISK